MNAHEDGGRISRADPHKRKRIIDAGLAGFREGYKLASTDAIAKNAGIAKGLLFDYFGSKYDFLWYLLRHAAAVVKDGYISQIDFRETDLLNRLLQAAYARLELSFGHPALFGFISGIQHSAEPVLSDARAWLDENLGRDFPDCENLLDGVSYDRFRAGVNPGTAVGAIRHALSGYLSAEQARVGAGESYWEGVNRVMAGLQEYTDLFRHTFYDTSKQKGSPVASI